jgi:hypothetical protein
MMRPSRCNAARNQQGDGFRRGLDADGQFIRMLVVKLGINAPRGAAERTALRGFGACPTAALLAFTAILVLPDPGISTSSSLLSPAAGRHETALRKE